MKPATAYKLFNANTCPFWILGLVALLADCLLLDGCVTTVTTFPDGRVVKTTSQDPAVVKAITEGVTDAAIQELKAREGFAK